MSYETIYEDSKQSKQEVVDKRDDTWDKLEESYVKPDPIGNVSEQINELLKEDSEYMQTARETSYKEYEQRGMLESEFWTSTGEVAAIDAVGKVASDNVQSDLYNQYIENELDIISYSAAYDSYLKELKTDNSILYNEFFSKLETEYNRINFGYDLENSELEHRNILEYRDAMHGYDMSYQDIMHGYDMEMKEVLFGYNTQLLDQNYGYQLEGERLSGEIELDQQYLYQAFNQKMTTNTLSVSNSIYYGRDYQAIMASNLEPESKKTRIDDLYNEHIRRQNELGEWTQVGDNPYYYEDSYYNMAEPPVDGYDTGPWYGSVGVGGGGVTLNVLSDFIDTIDQAFRDEMSTDVRHKYDTAKRVDNIKEHWPGFVESNPAEAEGIRRWFEGVIESGWLQSDELAYEDVIDQWFFMMAMLPIPEYLQKWYAMSDSSKVDLDGKQLPPDRYYTYSLDENGDIAFKNYRLVDGEYELV